MNTPFPYLIPVYRGVTVVGTALQRDRNGDLAHVLVVDTTLPEQVEVVYEVRPAKPRG